MGQLKRSARENLAGKHTQMLMLFLLSQLTALLCGNLPIITDRLLLLFGEGESGAEKWVFRGLIFASVLLAAVVLSPLKMWRELCFFRGVMGKTLPSPGSFFAPHRLFRAVLCRLYFTGLHLGRFLLFELPFSAVLFLSLLWLRDNSVSPPVFLSLWAFSAATFLCGAVFTALANGAEQLYWYALFKCPGLSPRQAARLSREALQGKLRRLFLFKLSFSGWFLLSALVVPAFYVWSYYKQSMAVLAGSLFPERK